MGIEVQTIAQECTMLNVVLDVSTKDYLSLDVEGHELHILQGVGWDAVRIDVMTIETTSEFLHLIEMCLLSRGYVSHMPDGMALLEEDAIFLHKDVVLDKPI